jgi:hypothetical protein
LVVKIRFDFGRKTIIKTFPAILLTISPLFVTLAATWVVWNLTGMGLPLPHIVIVVTSIWAASDSSKIKLKRYRSGISYGPIVLFIGLIGLWIVAFPCYLSVRCKILRGQAVMKFSDMPLPLA